MHASPPPDSSLADRAGARIAQIVRNRGRASFRPTALLPRGRREWFVAAAVALLIASIPLTIRLIAAQQTLSSVLAQKALGTQSAQSLRVFYSHQEAGALLRRATERASATVTLDRLSAVLPEDATIASAQRDADGALTLRIATNDPDRLRAALHRDPLFARLHDRDQREVDGVMLVTLKDAR